MMWPVHGGSSLAGRYLLGERIGSGGVGQVWSARDSVLGREVAIKVQQVDPDLDRATFERFVREARSAAGLSHPNVVTIFDSGTDGDTAYLVMELLPGPTLTGYLAEHGVLSEDEAVALARQIASGLAAAHAAGVVHRDIKPANLMFDGRGTLKIVDFGIARLTQSVTTRLTVGDGIIGSPPFLAPEGIDGGEVDERSDLYALGAVVMVMLTGHGPFHGTHPLALLQQHLYAPAPQLRDRRADISPALNALVAQLLSKAAVDRPQSARAVIDRLDGAPYAAVAPPVAATPPLQPAAEPPPVARAPEARAHRPRARPLLNAGFLAGAAAMALVAAVLVLLVGRGAPTAGQRVSPPLAMVPSVAAASTSGPAPTTPASTDAPSRTPQPSSGPTTRSPVATSKPTAPTRTPVRSSTAPPSGPASAPAAARPSTVGPTPPPADGTSGSAPSLQSALSALDDAVRAVVDEGQIGGKGAADLERRTGELSHQLETRSGAKATKKVDDYDRYVGDLAEKGDLTAAGRSRISAALDGVRSSVTP